MIKTFIGGVLFFFLSFNCFAQPLKTTLTYSVSQPVNKTSRTPVLILLHGFGSNESDLFELARVFDKRFIIFSLRAPNTSKNGGFSWYDLEFLPDRQFKYNYIQAKESRVKILSFISSACRSYHVDSTQVFLLGFSQGAIMAYDLAISSPDKIKGVLALSGRMMPESMALKTDWTRVAGVKFFITHGNSDNLISKSESEKASAFLKDKKVKDLTLKQYDMQHSINEKELDDIKSWLVKAIN